MIPKNPTTLRLMEALLAAGSQGAHRESLVRLAGISTASFYRSVEPLLAADLVHEQGGHFMMPLERPYNYAFKLWHDQDRLQQMGPGMRAQIASILEQLRPELGENILCLWLVGSAAHQTTTEASDLDLLAMVKKSREYPLRAGRAVQLTTLTRAQFRQLHREGDGFLRSALQHGLVLWDGGFAQPFYARPDRRPARRSLREREERLEKLRRHLLFIIGHDALEEGRDVLSRLAVGTGRLMLERLGELPAGKRDLVDGMRLYFGHRQAELVRTCLNRKGDAKEIIDLQGELEDLYRRFVTRAPLLVSLVQGLSGGQREFEACCATILESLDLPLEGGCAHGLVKMDAAMAAIECRSLKGGLKPGQLRRPPAWSGPVVLVANLFREVPVRQRPGFTSDLEEEARRLDISLLDSRKLLQFHNRFWLEPSPPSPSTWLSQTVGLSAAKKRAPRGRSRRPGAV